MARPSRAVNGALRSMPAQKALSPAPVNTTARTSSLVRSPCQTVRNSSCMVAVKALRASGLSRVTHATLPRSS